MIKSLIFNKYFLFALVSSLIFVSCTDEEIVNKAEEELITNRGSIVNIANVTGGFFNLLDKENTAVSFDLSTAGESISNIIVYKSYNGGDRVEHAIVDPVSTLTVSLQDAISGLGITLDDVNVGDSFNFSFESETPSGTYKSGNSLDVPASCPSDLAGTYSFTTTATSTDGCCPDPLQNSGEIVIEGENGSYTLLDVTAGVYFMWYDIYGITMVSETDGSLSVPIRNVCGTISGSAPEPFGTDFVVTGSVDDDGVITYNWSNGYEDQGEVVLTPM